MYMICCRHEIKVLGVGSADACNKTIVYSLTVLDYFMLWAKRIFCEAVLNDQWKDKGLFALYHDTD